jgi:hypothetical protein
VYRQLAEIHTIATAQLVECARWHWSNSTPSLVQARTILSRPVVAPSMIRLATSPPTDFSSQAPQWRQGQRDEPEARNQANQGSVGKWHKHRTQSLRQGGHRNSLRNVFEETCDIATQCTASYKAIMLCPAQGSREVSPSSDREMPSNITAMAPRRASKVAKEAQVAPSRYHDNDKCQQ